uniref:Reverse transcriptase domain-containing protein n=1 Tax=Angiostrongylus cantonensis TaxID=6313 RepID=A0A0K0DQG3_ANGCA
KIRTGSEEGEIAETSVIDQQYQQHRHRQRRPIPTSPVECLRFPFLILLFQMDPSSQHLHTLGNESAKYEEIKRVKKFGKDLNFSPETMPEFLVRGENIAHIRSGGSLCLKTFRRVEYADHHVSQHVRCINSLSDLVVRCPNWQRGCTFYTARLRPKCGIIRENTSLSRPLDTLPAWLIITLLKYLPNSITAFCNFYVCSGHSLEKVWRMRAGKYCWKLLKLSLSIHGKSFQSITEMSAKVSNFLSLVNQIKTKRCFRQPPLPVIDSNIKIVHIFSVNRLFCC